MMDIEGAPPSAGALSFVLSDPETRAAALRMSGGAQDEVDAEVDDARGWPEPDQDMIRDGRPAPPAFPAATLGGFSGWVEVYAASKSAPVDYAAAGLLAVAAAALGDVRHVTPWCGWTEPPGLWIALVGEPSLSKSPVLGPMEAVVREVESEENSDLTDRRRAFDADKLAAKEQRDLWQADLKEAVKSGRRRPDIPAGAAEPEEPRPSQIVIDDATVEALAPLFRDNRRGLFLLRDELAGWILNFDRYGGGGDAAFFLARFNGAGFTVDRKKDNAHISVPRALLSVLGGVQPEALAECLLKRVDDGFVSRFLFAYPAPVPRIRPTEQADLGRLKRAMRRLRGLPFFSDNEGKPRPSTLDLIASATAVFEDWWTKSGAEAREAIGFYAGFLGKGPGVVLRLALVLEYLAWADGPETHEPVLVGENSVTKAISLFEDYFKPMAARVFGGADMTRTEVWARALLRHLRREPQVSTINVTELRRAVPGLRETEDVKAVLEALQKGGWVRPAPARQGHSKGRQRGDWAVNPILWAETTRL
jgi:hypothetical protein